MQDEQQDILYRAAEVWKELTEYHYVFTYGYKGELHEIKLTFSPEDFPHLAGFHYLKDIALPRYSPRKTVDMILSGKITYDKVKKGTLYQEYVKPRLLALVRLKEILEQEFDLFSYMCSLSGNPPLAMRYVTFCVVLLLKKAAVTTVQTNVLERF